MADEALTAFLNEGTSAAAAPTQEAAPPAKTDEAPAADQTPVVKEGDPPAPGQQAQDQDGKGEVGPIPYDRFKKELDKRHELEREAAELRGRLSALDRPQTQTPPKTETPKPSDEERFFLEGHKLLEETREGLQGNIGVVERKLGYEISELKVRQAHPDFDEKQEVFKKALAESLQLGDPTLQQRFLAAPDPARFVYETGAAIKEWGGAKSPAEYRAKVEAEIRASVEEKVRKELALGRAANASTTNAGARSTGGNAAPTQARVIPDKDIFPGAMR
jgi:hypothetical protein